MTVNPHDELQQKLFNTGDAEMFCDGASSGNPGPSGIGVVIKLNDEEAIRPGKNTTYRISEYIGETTNNVAEYTALLKGLEKLKFLGVKRIRIFVDSELLARQINGIYRVRHSNLIPLWTTTMNILKSFSDYSITHIPREMNKEADSLARRAAKGKNR
jgi:ribonuclease HI